MTTTEATTQTLQQAQLKARLDHLFRISLSRQEINPLMHMVWRYRLEQLAKGQAQ
jgi:hypothetical protein